jgi:hypothetical protein
MTSSSSILTYRGRGGYPVGTRRRTVAVPAGAIIPALCPTDTLFHGYLCSGDHIAYICNLSDVSLEMEAVAREVRKQLPPEWKQTVYDYNGDPALVIAMEANEHLIDHNGWAYAYVKWMHKRYWNAMTHRECDGEDVVLGDPNQLIVNYLKGLHVDIQDSKELLLATLQRLCRAAHEGHKCTDMLEP